LLKYPSDRALWEFITTEKLESLPSGMASTPLGKHGADCNKNVIKKKALG